MRHGYLLVLSLALGWPLAAHAQQPFEQLGVKVEILSLSHGRFPEYFDNDSLRRIGSVIYDTRRERIAYLLPPDSLVGRMESEITARWLTVDPLAEEDAHLSPYVFCANNAVRYNDPDGRKVIYGAGASDQLKKDFAKSVKYMNAHGTGGNLAALQASKETYTIVDDEPGKGPRYTYEDRTIHWNSRLGAKTTSGNKTHRLSPTTLLGHEADHANQHDKNPEQYMEDRAKDSDAQYDTKEERRVITGSEQETARKQGEIGPGETTRQDHQPGELYPTVGPTSPKPAPTPPPAPKPKEDKQ